VIASTLRRPVLLTGRSKSTASTRRTQRTGRSRSTASTRRHKGHGGLKQKSDAYEFCVILLARSGQGHGASQQPRHGGHKGHGGFKQKSSAYEFCVILLALEPPMTRFLPAVLCISMSSYWNFSVSFVSFVSSVLELFLLLLARGAAAMCSY